ncbi:MAG TPA: preprotein translocase subunit SecG [Ruminococcaceae bacterium]|jgi:preprotein translocase subunit SecG|nr:preprotein translocase subunit SecG [Oscillospiraceae bacterium]HCA72084.1 preprotein translocase subunit SecG [Oscillospiraceae bacterium]HCC01807.1 preprotein translocase subunit SecG [Oscillospiraceae bacterium]HCM23483.1 preprotein translocase subunit SecG [Oscillospiraceae bacterium]
MSVPEIVMGIILIIASLAIIVVVLLQEGHEKDVGVVTGGADTFLSQNSARSIDTFLARWTKIIALAFFIFVIGTNIYMFMAHK